MHALRNASFSLKRVLLRSDLLPQNETSDLNHALQIIETFRGDLRAKLRELFQQSIIKCGSTEEGGDFNCPRIATWTSPSAVLDEEFHYCKLHKKPSSKEKANAHLIHWFEQLVNLYGD